MITAVGDALTAVIGWVGNVVTAITTSTGALYALLPVFAISIGVSLLLVGVKIIRRICYGA